MASQLFTQSGLITQGDVITQTFTQTQDSTWPGGGVHVPAAPRLDDFNSKLNLGVEAFDDVTDAVPDEHQQLPEHACSYCGVHNPACVAKCLSTGKWFCNSRSTKAGACMIVHLVKSKNKEVQLHKDSPLGDAVLECYATGTRNVFLLGFVPVKGENTVVLLARDTPGHHPAIKDLNLDVGQWQPIVEERCLVSWLVKQPTERDKRAATPVSLELVTQLEEAWRTRPAAKLDDVEALLAGGMGDDADEASITPVALKYKDVHEYCSVFRPLVKLEADYDRAMKEGQSRDNISVRWDYGLNRKRCAYFYFLKDDAEVRLLPGDELRLRHPAAGARGTWEGTGYVLRCDQYEEVCLEMAKNDVPEDVTTGYHVDFVWKSTSFDRMRGALAVLDKDKTAVTPFILHTLLGHEPELVPLRIHPPKKGLDVPNLPPLNHSQLAAVKAVLSAPVSLVQGPPGTGKTVTSAAVIYHIVQACKRPDAPCVLVAAPSNVAVDHLAHKISQTGLKVVRLCAKSREDVASPCQHLTLHYQVRHVELPGGDLYRKLLQLRGEQGGLRVEDEKQLFNTRRKLEARILEAADVICCTCVGAGDPRLKGFRFHHVLVDEATQATEPECLVPMVMGAKQVVLVGDHCQLPPVIMCKKAGAAGLTQSLFERLRLLGVKPIRLAVQYRMHPCLSEFPSNAFYEGSLQNGIGVGDRLLRGVDFPWPAPDKPMMFYCQLGSEEISGSGTSYLNRTEAANVEKIVTRLLTNGLLPSQIGVITPYEGQRAHVVSVMARQGTLRQDLYADIEVSSVDAFQGREKDIIVLSCVRSNEQHSVGFLGDPRRLNVALTRARCGLVILGNPRVLSRTPLWRSLLQHFREAGCLVEGPLNNLKQSLVQLGHPRKTFDRASFGVGALTSNRYQPPERVGDPLPSAQQPQNGADGASQPGQAQDGSGLHGSSYPGGGLGRDHKQQGPRGGPAATAAGGADAGGSKQQGGGGGVFMPFTMPSYVIPTPGAASSQMDGFDSRLFTQAEGMMMTARTQAGTQAIGLPGAGFTFATQLQGGATQLGLEPTGTSQALTTHGGADMVASAWPGQAAAAGAGMSMLSQPEAYDTLLLSQAAGGGGDLFIDPVTGQPL